MLGKAKYKLLDDGTYYGDIPSLRGVWSNAKTLEKCREELAEVLEEWVIFSIRREKKIPGLNINFSKLTYA